MRGDSFGGDGGGVRKGGVSEYLRGPEGEFLLDGGSDPQAADAKNIPQPDKARQKHFENIAFNPTQAGTLSGTSNSRVLQQKQDNTQSQTSESVLGKIIKHVPLKVATKDRPKRKHRLGTNRKPNQNND